MSNDVPTNMFETTKIGRVLISTDAIKEEPEKVRNIMSYLIPIVVQVSKQTGMVDYTAICDQFDELHSHELIPVYTNQIHNDGSVSFLRTTYKRMVKESVKDEIMKTIIENNINLEDFKAFIKRHTAATEEDFQTYDETFLEALNIYLARTRNKK